VDTIAKGNLVRLQNSGYPGRGIVLGLTPSGKELVVIYWIMGRSASSQNRIIRKNGHTVMTAPFDASLEMEGAHLKIYNASVHMDKTHIVSNGRQTDTILDYLGKTGGFEEALRCWAFEDDGPIFTPRISGIVFAGDPQGGYKLSIIKALEQNPALLSRQFFEYDEPLPGYGHCVHTYSLSQTCMPFDGEPYWTPILDGMDENADCYWNALPGDKRVALYVKHIDRITGGYKDKIINLHHAGEDEQ